LTFNIYNQKDSAIPIVSTALIFTENNYKPVITMKFNLFFPLLLLSLVLQTATAQEAAVRPGEVLLQLTGDAVIENITGVLRGQRPDLNLKHRVLSERWRMYALESAWPEAELLRQTLQIGGVQAAQLNHRTEERNTEPNDTEWWRQRNMEVIGMPKVWDRATGGVTPAGDTIVVAILEENGAKLDHPDVLPNLWRNYKEIPGNNRDDDANGIVDDFFGYDARNDKGISTSNNGVHGTFVNGIIGAKGNNSAGISGINWHVKLLNVSNTDFEDEIIAGYNYVADMRRLYNQTNGQKGAFIVATNASFGINNRKASQHPLWCAVYDSLGIVGVISAGATTNRSVDVDVVGDMPTTCPSQYLISVTNIENSGQLTSATGYGSISIDLGAPGQNIYSTATNAAGYATDSGTSFSTPHVAGAVALMYSLPCNVLASDARTQPAACARRIRDSLLLHVTKHPSLEGVTTTGGHLALDRSVDAVLQICVGRTGPLDIVSLRPNPVSDQLNMVYLAPDYTQHQVRVYNTLGQLMQEETIIPAASAEPTHQINVAAWPKGVYFVTFGQGNIYVAKKFLKK
jgi:subtilisin family serine protease